MCAIQRFYVFSLNIVKYLRNSPFYLQNRMTYGYHAGSVFCGLSYLPLQDPARMVFHLFYSKSENVKLMYFLTNLFVSIYLWMLLCLMVGIFSPFYVFLLTCIIAPYAIHESPQRITLLSRIIQYFLLL